MEFLSIFIGLLGAAMCCYQGYRFGFRQGAFAEKMKAIQAGVGHCRFDDNGDLEIYYAAKRESVFIEER